MANEAASDGPRRLPGGRKPIQIFSLPLLIAPLVFLAAATCVLLFAHSDTDVPMLYSQCHSYERIPALSRGLPGLGPAACALISFFQEALASARTFAVLAAILSFVAGLLTVCTVEAARICNGPSRFVIARPTAAWLLFNLLGGAVVWQLIIVPSFFLRDKKILARRARAQSGPVLTGGATDPELGESMRHLASGLSEVVAIPVAVAVGYILPSVLMLVLDEPISIGIWLFFPVYVSAIRRVIRYVIAKFDLMHSHDETLHLESSRPSLLAVYALPVLCSVLSHALLIYNLATQPDDRRQMTRATVTFIEIDIGFIGVTLLYWLFVEAGWKAALAMIGSSVVLGPGAGVCISWIFREHVVAPDAVVTCAAQDARDLEHGHARDRDDPGEDAPLLR